VDYLFLNRDEALLYARQGELPRAIASWRRSPRTVVIKLGAGGSRLVGGLVNVHAAAMRVRAIETTGAGDAFNAGFLAARLRGADLMTALTLANRVGALSTLEPGGTKALAYIKRVMKKSRS
jgi:sugar/nucleoside kinase (ribokinase family)